MAKAPRQSASRNRSGNGISSWSDIWHLPVLLLGLGLFILGVYSMIPSHGGPHFRQALNSVAEYLKADNLDGTQKNLKALAPIIARASPHQQGRYWQYWADLNYEQQKKQNPTGIPTKVSSENNRKIVKYYTHADKLMGQLAPDSLQRYVRTLVALDRDKQALAMVDRLKNAPVRQRYLIVRDLIVHQQKQPNLKPGAIQPLIDRFQKEIARETDPARQRRQRVWITNVQAKMRLDADDPNGTVDFLLRHIQRLKPQAGDQILAPLYVLLAQAYQQMGQYEDARRYYRFARKNIPDSSGLNARILVGLGQIALADNASKDHQQQALQLFTTAIRNYPSEQPADLEALIGQADVNARMGNDDAAIRTFQRAADTLVRNPGRWPGRRQKLVNVVSSHISHANDDQNYRLALRLLQTLLPLHKKHVPAKLLLDLATTHQHLAEKSLQQANPPASAAANQPVDQASTAKLSTKARRLLNQQAASHFGAAAAYFLKYAHAVTITNDQAYGMALWQAGVDYDKAQQWKDAIKVYSTYVRTRPDDPRRLKAINHLGKAFLADGQYDPAIDRFKQLIKNHPNSLQAFASLVPLAQAYIAENKTGPAKRTLLQVVTDHPSIRPDSDTYRNAVIALGKLYYRLGAKDQTYYVKAIERLTEAVKRYGDSAQGPVLRFLLADSYRQSVKALDQRLRQTQAQNVRAALKTERDQRLEKAQMYYNQVINELEARNGKSLSPLERLYHRNAYFYQADCAYERGRYRLAIRLYSQANRKWSNYPASLVALVQIVNAYCALGEYHKAKVINDQALWQLQRMPDSAFNKPSMPMTRRNWEDWLRWSDKLDLFGNGAKATNTSGP